MPTPPTFIDNFLRYNEDTEPPKIYYLWSALALISALLSKRVYYPSGDGIPPLIYTLFIGQQGNGKDQAAAAGKKILSQLAPEIIGADTTSTSRLMIQMSKKLRDYEIQGHISQYSPLAVYATELESMSSIEDDFFKTLVALFSQTEFIYDTHAHEKVVIIEPAVTFLGCTNPTSFAQFIKTGRLSQGFARRCPLIYAPKRYQDLFEYANFKTLEKQLEFKRLVNQASIFARASGEFTPTPEWKALGEADHFKCRKRVAEGEFTEQNIAAHYDNRKDLIFRLSMISCMERQVGHIKDQVEADNFNYNLTLQPGDFHAADSWLKGAEAELPAIYSLASPNPEINIEVQLLSYLTVPRSTEDLYDLLSRHMSYKASKEYLDGLKFRGIISYEPDLDGNTQVTKTNRRRPVRR